MTETDVSYQEDEQDNSAAGQTETASEMLVHARESMGLSQKDVADQLYLTETFIRYIDEGDFHKIPKVAFVKGYLRSYARVVSLDKDEVIAAYERDQNITPQAQPIGQVTEEAVGSGSFTGPVVQTGIIALVALVVVAGMVWWFATGGDGGGKNPVVATQPSSMPDQPAPQAEKAAQAAQEKTDMPQQQMPQQVGTSPETTDAATMNASVDEAQSQTDQADDDTEAGKPAGSAGQTVQADDVKIERVRDGDTQYITVKAGGSDEMEFAFTGKCWVEITDASGKKIYGDLNRAGDVMSVYGVAPFEVLLGKAPVVSMTYQGNTVNLTPYTTKDETAKIRTVRL